ncbi:MAG: 50S ribosomal protein L17 [Turicibacter sp.]|nr:50S ribosomal protein L17 [Turicibacter sp.]
MADYRKLGRTSSSQRKAMLRSLATNLLYHDKIVTTEARAKEVRRLAEKLITLAIKEHENYTEETIKAKIPQKDAKGNRVKKEVDGKRVTVFDEVDKTIKKDKPSRLIARRKILSVLYPVTDVPKDGRKKRSLSKKIDMPARLFDTIAPRYTNRRGGYTRIVKIGPRKGDAAEMVLLELV